MSIPLLRRRTVLSAALLCFAVPPIAGRAADPAVIAPIQRLSDSLLDVMKAGRGVSFEQRVNQLAPTVDAVFDLSTILQTSIGLAWAQLSADQHAALLTAFRRYTIATYVSNFNQFNGQRFEISPDTRALPNNEQMVSSRIIPASGESHQLDYVMRQGTAGWQAVDVLADGTISRVAVQRSDFRHLLMQGGGATLLASLRRKSDDLAAGG
jgi:phospholipid transport system substrate-binding protein